MHSAEKRYQIDRSNSNLSHSVDFCICDRAESTTGAIRNTGVCLRPKQG